MQYKIFLLALAGNAFAATNHFSDPMPEKANGVPLAYVGKDSKAATDLTLTYHPDGRKDDAYPDIGYLPAGSALHVLLVDEAGNHLVKTAYGITGWTQARANPTAGDDNFPPLEAVKKGDYTLHYNPKLGEKQDKPYYVPDINGEAQTLAGLAPKDAPAPMQYHRLLETALKPDGARYTMECSDYELPVCRLAPADGTFPPAPDSEISQCFGDTFPGNGYLYSIGSYFGGFYLPKRDKLSVTGEGCSPLAQPYYYLGISVVYRNTITRQDNRVAFNTRAVSVPLFDRIDGSKTVTEIAPDSKIRLILGKESEYAEDVGARDSWLWLLVQTKDGTTGWLKTKIYEENMPSLELDFEHGD